MLRLDQALTFVVLGLFCILMVFVISQPPRRIDVGTFDAAKPVVPTSSLQIPIDTNLSGGKAVGASVATARSPVVLQSLGAGDASDALVKAQQLQDLYQREQEHTKRLVLERDALKKQVESEARMRKERERAGPPPPDPALGPTVGGNIPGHIGIIPPFPAQPYFHFVFNTDCVSFKAQWTSVNVVHTFLISQPKSSRLTEIISCDKEHTPPYSKTVSDPRVQWHVAPLWSPHPVIKDHYPPYNKPKSMMDWLENGKDKPPPHAVIVVVDPDMLLMRPFNPQWLTMVTDGTAIANNYAFGTQWMNGPLGTLCPKCKTMSQPMKETYIVGTPVLMTASDMKRVAPRWLRRTEEIREDPTRNEKGGWISEMYGYVLGTIDCDVKHLDRKDLMVTSANSPDEWADRMPHYTIHYCQSYVFGDWKWNKHDFHRENLLSCSRPLFELPPQKATDLSKADARQAYLAHTIIMQINEAQDAYKSKVCPNWPTQRQLKFNKQHLESTNK